MRRRDISPDFWTDERVVDVSDAAKLAFIGIWQVADREGRLEDKPRVIGMKIRPWDAGTMPALIDELVGAGLLIRYVADGQACLGVPGFARHQSVHPREMISKLPSWEGPGAELLQAKANLGEPRQEITPGSSGSSGPSGSSGSSGPAVASKPRRVREKAQAQLPGVPEPIEPPRKQSAAGEVWEFFVELRNERLDDLGFDVEKHALKPNWPFIAAQVEHWYSHLDEERDIAKTTTRLLLRAYFEDPYWASATTKTGAPEPYPWNVIASEKVWRGFLAKVNAMPAPSEALQ